MTVTSTDPAHGALVIYEHPISQPTTARLPVDRSAFLTGLLGKRYAMGHGPIGYYVCSSSEEAEREKQKHLAICNQCREDEGLPLLESSPYLSRTEFRNILSARREPC